MGPPSAKPYWLRRYSGFGGAARVVRLLLELVHLVEARVAEELEDLAVEVVGARLGGGEHDAADGAVLGRAAADVHPELTNARLRHFEEFLTGVVDLILPAVHVRRREVGVGPSRADGWPRAPRARGQLRPRQQQRQRASLPIGNRQHLDLLLRDDGRHLGRRRFDDGRLGGDGNRLLHTAERHRQVLLKVEANRQVQVVDISRLEAIELGVQRVPARLEASQPVLGHWSRWPWCARCQTRRCATSR